MKQLPEPNEASLPARVQYVEVPSSEMMAGPESGGLLDYWRILRRRKGALFLFAFSGLLLAILLSLPQTPVYQAQTTLEILNINENVLNTRELEPTAALTDYSPEFNIQTQVKILQSQSLVARVLRKLDQRDPEKLGGGRTRVSAWRQALGLREPVAPSEEQLVTRALAGLKAQAVARTRLVEVRYDSTDPRLAADFLNTLASEFIDQNVEVRWQTSQRTGDWLSRQLQDLKIKLEKAEDELQTYARTTGLLYTGEQENVAEQKLKQVQEELSRAQADRTTKQSRYELARSAPPESLPEILDDKPLADYQSKLTELRRQLAELSSSLTPEHYKVKRVEAQIATLEAARAKHQANVLARIRNEFEAAQRRERLLARDYTAQSATVSSQAQRAVHYNILKREVDTHRQLYEALLQKVKEYGIASAMHASNVRVVDEARPPRLPYKPNYPMNSALGLISGLFLGVVFVVMRERADRTIQAPGDAPFYLDVPELGVIPAAGAKGLGYYHRRAKDTEGEEKCVEMVTWRRKPSIMADSFRAVLASLLFAGKNGDRPRVIVLTSPNPQEGKTTVASNLALALAEIHHRVLLIDADLRKPRMHEIFHLPNDWGLSDLLEGHKPRQGQEAQLIGTGYDQLYLLPAGSPKVNAASLLHSPRMAEFLARARDQFDMILIDTPPMLHIPDARVLGRLADGVILVIRANSTTRDMAQAAGQRLLEDGARVLGTILNYWDPKRGAGYGYGYRYGYRYYTRTDSGAS